MVVYVVCGCVWQCVVVHGSEWGSVLKCMVVCVEMCCSVW